MKLLLINFFLTFVNPASAGFGTLDLVSTTGGPRAAITWSQEDKTSQWKFTIKGKVAQFVGRDSASQLDNFSMRVVDRKNNIQVIAFTTPQGRFSNDMDFEAIISTQKAELITVLQNENQFLDIELAYDVVRGTARDHFINLINLNSFCKTYSDQVLHLATAERGCFNAKVAVMSSELPL